MRSSFLLSIAAWALLATANSHALTLTDSNSNGMSDYWEKHWNNGAIFPSTFSATADPDGDGWNNLTESVAGTNPNDPQPPTGLVQTKIIESPAAQTMEEEVAKAFVISWPTVIGKQYKLLVSSDLSLGNWVLFDQPMMGTGSEIQIAIEPLNEDGTRPTRLFWRVSADDTDTDGDSLSDYEETAKGTNPLKSDTDGDGLPDNTDPASLASATVADPDGLNLPSSLSSNLRGFWDFETQNNGTTVPAIFPDRSGANRHATSYSAGPQPYGMPSKAAKISPQYMTLPISTFQGQATWTISGWLKFTKGGISGLGTGNKIIYALYDLQGTGPSPQKAPLAQGTILAVAKVGTTEQWFVGGYKQTYYTNEPGGVPGNALTKYNGHTFSLPAGSTDDGEWHQFAVTRSNTTNGQKVYFDGQVAFQGDLLDYNEIDYDSDTTFTLGRLYPAHTAAALPEAYVDRIRVHSKLLSAAEVSALYRQDIDRDGLWDVTENATGLWRDANSNGIQDLGETNYIVSPFVAQPVGDDADNDGLSNILEQTIGTKIANPDTDGDFMPDGWEYKYSSMAGTSLLMMAAAAPPTIGYLDPLVADAAGDLDGDGVSNLNEYRYACDPRSKDTDGDGKNDNVEIGQGSGPDDTSDGGNPIPAAERFSAVLGIGDKSGSKSEDYIMNCFRIDPETGEEKRIYTLRSGGFGEYKEETQSIFKKGETYTFQIDWQSSKLTSRSSSPGVSAEGPDFDYTFKVEPQGTGTGYLVDSWNKSKSIVESPILAADASDAATSAAEFTEKYESKRVAIVNLKLEWESIYDDASLSDHFDPTTNQKNGKRWFPDAPTPKASGFRDYLNVKVSGGLPNMPFWLRSFDVDDTTASSVDPDGIVDTNGPDGLDNRTISSRTVGVGQAGIFIGEGAVPFGRFNGKLDSKGSAKAKMLLGVSPGNNYRVTGTVKAKAELENLFTTISGANPTKVISPDSSAKPTFDGGITPTLTIWRRLWMEFDSMGSPLNPPSGEENWIDVNVVSVSAGTPLPNGDPLYDCVIQTGFSRPRDEFENGWLISNANGTSIPVKDVVQWPNGAYVIRTTQNPGATGWYKLRDDDETGLPASVSPLLPKYSIDYTYVGKKFNPAFIEIADGNSSQNNPNRNVPFQLNRLTHSTLWNATKDIEDKPELWAATTIFSYQPKDALGQNSEDGDPSSEDLTGGTTLVYSGCSAIYLETIRDEFDPLLRNSSSYALAEGLLKNAINLTVCHEIGHQPSNIYIGDHSELGIMIEGGTSGTDDSFTAKTIDRFRRTKQWSLGTPP